MSTFVDIRVVPREIVRAKPQLATTGWLVYCDQADGTKIMVDVVRGSDLLTREMVLQKYKYVPRLSVEPMEE